MNPLFQIAAQLLLEGDKTGTIPEAEAARRLLADLDYMAPASLASPAQLANRVALLRAAGQMSRLFGLAIPSAPGLVFLGGEADPAAIGESFAGAPTGSLAGSGLALREAFESCVGEGVEYLSQFEQAGDSVAPTDQPLATIDAFPDCAPAWPNDSRSRDWVRGQRLADGEAVLLPADRCLRRGARVGVPPLALSTGCGAGASFAAAALHGLLELVERDAAGLWWRGGRRARPLDGDAAQVADAMVAALRQGQADRRTWVLDITTDLEVPCAAAISLGLVRNQMKGFGDRSARWCSSNRRGIRRG